MGSRNGLVISVDTGLPAKWRDARPSERENTSEEGKRKARQMWRKEKKNVTAQHKER